MSPELQLWFIKYLKPRLHQMWSWYPPRKQVKNSAYLGIVNGEQTWRCAICKLSSNRVEIDHIVPKGREPKTLAELFDYVLRWFCPADNLQCACKECHKLKTKLDIKKIRSQKS